MYFTFVFKLFKNWVTFHLMILKSITIKNVYYVIISDFREGWNSVSNFSGSKDIIQIKFVNLLPKNFQNGNFRICLTPGQSITSFPKTILYFERFSHLTCVSYSDGITPKIFRLRLFKFIPLSLKKPPCFILSWFQSSKQTIRFHYPQKSF